MLVGEFGTGSTKNPLIDNFLYFHPLSSRSCIVNVRRNSVLVTYGSWKVKQSYFKLILVKKMNQEESKTDTRIKSVKRRPEATESTWNFPRPNQTQLQKYTIKTLSWNNI